MIKPELFDVVELIIDMPDKNIFIGSQGTILEDYGDNAYEIEFANENGETIYLSSFTRDQFIVIWKNSTKQWVSISDKLMSIINKLSEKNQEEVFNFARSLNQN
ncbi:MAG: DUF4926 domain-containing protein [Cyanobacteria bacterium]|nr:DUF4926 domain-containing protein [Cyanobacteria bacterium CG_2015-16_32_12]NCO78143.1 DUF4926 domain-containing protein [Cyanobacteria bacterium CG_2015-22_32_23]NCQ04095.1 DUF4926 domain-containing protein [Cyanobacteria bacterium CG_2015-09_32_10]NCQ42013.1 DUF4926 domain-containing protein [Cyanobacteria bacterium CG_2015-04_32_10]NCS83904.1 DUF4926 domain-containing protein [Cyanobacteria bacterium CG_2015-02_32_10]